MNPLFILGLFFLSCNTEKKVDYTGSTPAHAVIRTFLNIPMKDSIDFIRWQLWIHDNSFFEIKANYGVGKPNTSGFYDGGKHVELKGKVEQKNNVYRLLAGTKQLELLIISEDLLHFIDEHRQLLLGTGGWSFTLNNMNASRAPVKIPVRSIETSDSIVFHGRTPCGIPTIISYGHPCNKLKWLVRLYGTGIKNGTYKLDGTAWRSDGTKTGRWEVVRSGSGQSMIVLKDNDGRNFLQLLMLDDNIAIFVDDQGHPYVGDKDFSYTLSRR